MKGLPSGWLPPRRHFGRMTADLLWGLGAAATVAILGWLSLRHHADGRLAEASLHQFATILTLLFGISSAVWWHQSAEMSNEVSRKGTPDSDTARDANLLSAAAATATAIALIASVLTGLAWGSQAAWLGTVGLLLLLAMSGDDLGHAIRISLRRGLTPRSRLGYVVLLILLGLYIRSCIG